MSEDIISAISSELGPMSSKAKARKLLKIMLEGVREPSEEMMSGLGGECLKWAPGAWITIIDTLIAQLTEEEVG